MSLSQNLSSPSASVRMPPHERIDGRDRIIVDLDGTLIRGGRPTNGARSFLERMADRYIVVSNNSTDTAAHLSITLGELGLSIPANRLVLAGEETIRFVAMRYPGARCLVAASEFLRKMAYRAGLTPVRKDAELVILGRDLRWDYRRLTVVTNELLRGASLIVTNPDLTHPDGEGRLIPETGSLMAAVVAAAGIRPTHVIGKPEPPLFEEALRRLEASPENTVVVGDNPLTDQEGARRLGLRCIMVDVDRRGSLPNLADLAAVDTLARQT